MPCSCTESDEMNILLINLSLRPFSPVKIFPIGLGYIATAIKNAGYAFDLLDIDGLRYSDREVENFIQAKEYDFSIWFEHDCVQ
jgi:anaerobic magnesium-protoporphyrin IX monomethyl ester cyclase